MLSINDAALLAEDMKAHISRPFQLLGFLIFITEKHWPDLYLMFTVHFISISVLYMHKLCFEGLLGLRN